MIDNDCRFLADTTKKIECMEKKNSFKNSINVLGNIRLNQTFWKNINLNEPIIQVYLERITKKIIKIYILLTIG
ncbi:hypothetical protein DERF_010403 [Dermatophagoides farinae]|uniref:Uncharacterized protein n=1 Tax=Dermatophagoides farinae TaxID=6954 RepID=A0A922L3I0_DERFA|nr:hypothetical protein DERF_010403 [Dermatophagoides farinae]